MKELNALSKRLGLLALILCIFIHTSFAQQTTTGKVVDSSGAPLPGVTVIVKGTTRGTVTGIEGDYSLETKKGETLLFSFVGMVPQEIAFTGQSQINVTLETDAIGIEEVVAVGYGTQKKVNLTGAISNVTAKELDARPITNMTTALGGLATGVHVSQGDGQPGNDGATIRIRGVGTLNDANPLILVDGVEASMADINPNDVESMAVLKDAASSAIYGSRAANGVILVTTKKGKAGELKVTYNAYCAWQSSSRMPNYVSDMATYMEIANEAWVNTGQTGIFSQEDIDRFRNNPDPIYSPNIDWVDVWYGDTAPMHSHHVSLSGGSDKSVYNLSLAYLDQEGITPDTWAKRYNFRMNWEGTISDKIKVGTNLSGSWKKRENPDATVLHLVPGIPYETDPEGRYGYAQVVGVGSVTNPRAAWENNHSFNRNIDFLGKVYLNWNITEELTFSTNTAIKFGNGLSQAFKANAKLWDFQIPEIVAEVNQITKSTNKNNESYTITNYNTLNYSKTFNEVHKFNALVGSSVEEFRNDKFSGSIDNFHNNQLWVLDAGLDNPQVTGTAAEWGLVSFFGRINYSYQDKYLFEGNVRYDGSSRFKDGNRWGVFPSFSLGWRVSEEDFMKDVEWVDNLKLRASWGKLGNQNVKLNGDPNYYPYQTNYALGLNYSTGGVPVSGIGSTAVVNSDIEWESTTTSNFGIDAILFGKLNVTAEYFNKVTDGILVGMEIPKTMGDKDKPVVNLAEVENKGWELAVNYQDNIGDFGYNVGFNVSNVKNEVTKYQGEVRSGGNFVTWEGQPFNSMYGYVADGIIRSQEEVDALNATARERTGNPDAYYLNNKMAPGDIKYRDLDGNGIIDSNDREIIGNTIPKYTYGVTLGANYKGLDFSALLQGIAGRDTYLSGTGVYPVGANGDRGMFPDKWVTDRFIPEDQSTWETASMPRVLHPSNNNNNYKFSTFWKQDGAYLRVKSVQLGYTIPKTKNYGIERMRVYVNGENLFTLTDYEGWDPERGATATGINQYPIQKTISAGIQVTF